MFSVHINIKNSAITRHTSKDKAPHYSVVDDELMNGVGFPN